jgi:hypothetical protein
LVCMIFFYLGTCNIVGSLTEVPLSFHFTLHS